MAGVALRMCSVVLTANRHPWKAEVPPPQLLASRTHRGQSQTTSTLAPTAQHQALSPCCCLDTLLRKVRPIDQ